MNKYQRVSPGMYRAPSGRVVTQQQMQHSQQQMQRQPMPQPMRQPMGGAQMPPAYGQMMQQGAQPTFQTMQDFGGGFRGMMSRGQQIDPGYWGMDRNQMNPEQSPWAQQMREQMMAQGPGGQPQTMQGPPPPMQFRPGTNTHNMMMAQVAGGPQKRAQYGAVEPQALLSMPPNMQKGGQ